MSLTQLSPEGRAHSWTLEALVVCALAAVTAGALYHRLLAPGHYYVAIDMVSIQVPFRTFIDRTVRLGQLPTWVPNVWLGVPFLANGDAALLYPLQLPLLVFGPDRGLGWNLWLHTSASIASVYALARLTLGLRPAAALAAGLAFALGGYALTHTGLLWAVYEAPWPPLVFLSLERAINGRLRWALLMPVAVALALLAGNPQELYYCSVWLGLLAVVLWLQAPSLMRAARILSTTAAGYAVGALLAAAQLLPQLQLVGLGGRGGAGLSLRDAVIAELSWISVSDLLLPTGTLHYLGEEAGWVGAIGFVLAAAGLARIVTGRTRALTGSFVVMAAGSYLLALGDGTPLFRIVFDWLPGMHQFRIPVRWLYPMSIAVAVLVGQGADVILDQAERFRMAAARPSARAMAGAAGAAFALAVGALAVAALTPTPVAQAWGHHAMAAAALYVAVGLAAAACVIAPPRLGRPALGVALAASLGLELWGLAQPLEWNHPAQTDIYAHRPPIPAYVATHGPGRVLSLAPDAPNVAVMRDDTPLSVGASSVTGYGTPWPTNLSQPLAAVVEAASRDDAAFTSRTAFWRLIDVRYVVAAGQRKGLAQDPDLTVRVRDGEWVLYELTGPSGRVKTYCGAQAAPEGLGVTTRVLRPDFSGDQLYVDAPRALLSRGGACGSAWITDESVDAVQGVAEMPEPGWLLLTDSWYPGWEALVDGQAVPLRQADQFFKAVQLPAGSHQVTFRFDPPIFHVGVALSLGAAMLWLGAIVLTVYGPRRWLNNLLDARQCAPGQAAGQAGGQGPG
jgi:hypothetical protein